LAQVVRQVIIVGVVQALIQYFQLLLQLAVAVEQMPQIMVEMVVRAVAQVLELVLVLELQIKVMQAELLLQVMQAAVVARQKPQQDPLVVMV
jgi:hypothetical protein